MFIHFNTGIHYLHGGGERVVVSKLDSWFKQNSETWLEGVLDDKPSETAEK